MKELKAKGPVQEALDQLDELNAAVDSLEAAKRAIVSGAEGAEKLLPTYEAKRDQLREELVAIEASIGRLKSIVAAAREFRPPESYEGLIDGAVGPDIDTMLLEYGAMTVLDLLEIIQERLGHSWARSTVSNHLSRGKTRGFYTNESGKWKLTDKGIGEML